MTPPASVARLLESSPLRLAPFRRFYIGGVGTALAYTMQVTLAAWLMATLTPSELMVALVQTASTVPTLLFALLAGSIADIFDRRRIIQVVQWGLLITTGILAAITFAGLLTPISLLLLTFVVGAGFTFYVPAQSASVNDMVPRPELPRAVALGAVAFNVSRALGPALAGGIAAAIGAGVALSVATALFAVMILSIRGLRWPRPPLPGVPETVWAGVRSGLRYARHSGAMRALVIRNMSFALCASALWALLPVVARDQLGMGAAGYGLLFACFGTGAVFAALLMPRQLQKVSLDTVVTSNTLLSIAGSLIVAATSIQAVALVGAAAAGAGWVGVLASLGAGMQTSAPGWVRARALSVNLMSVQASLAVGSALWGALASVAGPQMTLVASAALMLALHFVNRRVHVELGADADVTPFAQLPELSVKAEPLPNDGPVLVQVAYQIEPAQRATFMRAIQAIEPTRRRNGASDWRVFRDLGEDGRFVERFIIGSWAEYIRSRARMTVADRKLQEAVFELQRADTPVRISRFLGIDPREASIEDEWRAAAARPTGKAPTPSGDNAAPADATRANAGTLPGEDPKASG